MVSDTDSIARSTVWRKTASARAESPENVEARYVLAVVLRDEVGDLDAADLEFREYLRLAPKGSHAEEAHGSLLTRLP